MKQNRPRYQKRKMLTDVWVQKALKYSPMVSETKNPASALAAAMSDVSTNRLEESERMRYKRYATTGDEGRSMDFITLRRFVEGARARNLLPPKSGIKHTSEFLLDSHDPDKMADDILALPESFYAKKAGLLKALSEYMECIEEADRLRILVVKSDSNSGESDEVYSVDVKRMMDLVEKHYLFAGDET